MTSWLETIGTFLINNSAEANVLAVFLLFVPGVFLWLSKPGGLGSHAALVHALEFWLFQWCPTLFVYFLTPGDPPGLNWVALSLVDLQTMFLFAFCFAMVSGDALKPTRAWIGIVLGAVTLFSYNIVVNLFPAPVGSFWRYAWILPSALVSSVALVLSGSLFVLRYGWIASPVLGVTFLYAMATWPIYVSTVVEESPDPHWFVVLAVGKILLSTLVYFCLAAPLKNFSPLGLVPADAEVRCFFKAKLLGFKGIVLAVIIAALGTIIGSLVIASTSASGGGGPH